MEVAEELLELAVEELVDAVEAAFGLECPLFEGVAVDDRLELELLGDALDPLALDRRPRPAGPMLHSNPGGIEGANHPISVSFSNSFRRVIEAVCNCEIRPSVTPRNSAISLKFIPSK